jgi:hypothetical protein
MGKHEDSGRIDLHRIFLRVQQMLANLSASEVFEHPTACGAATERHWIDLFNRYLPRLAVELQRRSAHINAIRCNSLLSPAWNVRSTSFQSPSFEEVEPSSGSVVK